MGGAHSPESTAEPEHLQIVASGPQCPAPCKGGSPRRVHSWEPRPAPAPALAPAPAPAPTRGPRYCFPGRRKLTTPVWKNTNQIWPGRVNNYLLGPCKHLLVFRALAQRYRLQTTGPSSLGAVGSAPGQGSLGTGNADGAPTVS